MYPKSNFVHVLMHTEAGRIPFHLINCEGLLGSCVFLTGDLGDYIPSAFTVSLLLI